MKIKLKKKSYDYIFIGAGSSLIILSKLLKKKKKIALVEDNSFGGTCLNKGCIPSKMLIYAAKLYSQCKEVDLFHINIEKIKANFSSLVEEVNKKIHKKSLEIKNFYKKSSVDVYTKKATFIDKNVIKTGSAIIQGKIIVLNVGAIPSTPPIEGLKNTPFMTSDDALKLKKCPKKLVIIGGGYIGLELAYYFSSFGSKIHILEAKSILNQEDPDIVDEFKKGFKKYSQISENVNIKRVDYKKNRFTIYYNKKKQNHKITCDNLLVSAGRAPNIKDLSLQKTDIKTDEKGFIRVNNHLQTTQKNIFAFGDCIHALQLKHLANFEAHYLSEYFLNSKKMPISYPSVPYAIFSYPEIANIGKSEKDLKKEKKKYFVKSANYNLVGKGWIMKEKIGFIKLIFLKKSKKLVGCSVIGKEASELIHILTAYIFKNSTFQDLKKTIFIHPTLAEIIPLALN